MYIPVVRCLTPNGSSSCGDGIIVLGTKRNELQGHKNCEQEKHLYENWEVKKASLKVAWQGKLIMVLSAKGIIFWSAKDYIIGDKSFFVAFISF